MEKASMNETNMEIKKIEELSLNAHPALQTIYCDGWYLRFSEGYTKRANSVNMLQDSELLLEEKITYCELAYQQQNLPTVFKMTPLSLFVDTLLEEKEYKIVDQTKVMTANELPTKEWIAMELSKMNFATPEEKPLVIIEKGITQEWQKNYFHLNGVNEQAQKTAQKIQSNIMNTTFCASILCNGEVVACGLCVIDRNFVGLYDIIVAKEQRKKGYGRILCQSLLSKAKEQGATKAYLQVVDSNEPAKKLYQSIGFFDFYTYWYRVK